MNLCLYIQCIIIAMNAPGNLHSEVGYFNLQFKKKMISNFFSCNTHKKKIEKSKKLNE